MVDTCITLFQNKIPTNETMSFIDTSNNFSQKTYYEVNQNVFKTYQAFFIPTRLNLLIANKILANIQNLKNQWWSKIETSEKIQKNQVLIRDYQNTLKAGDMTIMGLITDGGQGLATANNGKYIGIKEGTKESLRTKEAREQKLFKAESQLKLGLKSKQEAKEFLQSKTEQEIRQIFDEAKEQFGRDIFGQGFLYRIVSNDEIANVSDLMDDEKANGIDSQKCFVPYDKGDKDGNRWYLPTPYYIAWNRENVKKLQTDSRARWQGYNFYFKEGFCWIDVNSTYLKCRLKQSSVNDVLSMSMYANNFSEKYLVCIINSTFMSKYVDTFINNTSHFQINDARQIPIIIPTKEQLQAFENLFDKAFASQKEKFEKGIDNTQALLDIQKDLDTLVYNLYFTDEEIQIIENNIK